MFLPVDQTAQHRNGKSIERSLDQWFKGLGYQIRVLSRYEERTLHLGDRELIKSNGDSVFVEYKSGRQTHYTGNLYIETVSVDTSEIPGWVYTCRADYIIFYIPQQNLVMFFRTNTLRGLMPSLISSFPSKKTSHNQNVGYNSEGVLLPLKYAMQIADGVTKIG